MMRRKRLLSAGLGVLRLAFASAVVAGTIACSPIVRDAYAAPDTFQVQETKLVFTSFPKGIGAKLVGDAWMKDPEYKDYTSFMHSPPAFKMGLQDINGDGVPEIFAKHADSEYTFCTDNGICRMHIYAATKDGLVEIGRIMAGEPVMVSATSTNGYRNLVVYGVDDKARTYVWDGKTYKPQ